MNDVKSFDTYIKHLHLKFKGTGDHTFKREDLKIHRWILIDL